MSRQLISPGIRILVAACAALLVAGCSSSGEHPAPGGEDASWIDYWIDEAESGASPSQIVASAKQIEILERGRIQGELEWVDVMEAIENTATCLEDRGLRLTMGQSSPHLGFETPQYSWGGPLTMSPHEAAALGDPCIEGESFYVEAAFANQPHAKETQEEFFDEHLRPIMEECLKRHDVMPEPDATMLELNVLALEILDEAMGMYANETGGNDEIIAEHNCLLQTYNEGPRDI